MAGIFVVASQRFPALLRQPGLSGPAYGVLIYFVMNYIAVPLSAAPNWKLPQGWAIVGGLLPHCFYVGLPIAAIARAFWRPFRRQHQRPPRSVVEWLEAPVALFPPP